MSAEKNADAYPHHRDKDLPGEVSSVKGFVLNLVTSPERQINIQNQLNPWGRSTSSSKQLMSGF
jgi:hypothetical protein